MAIGGAIPRIRLHPAFPCARELARHTPIAILLSLWPPRKSCRRRAKNLPDPETPVNHRQLVCGMSTLMFLRCGRVHREWPASAWTVSWEFRHDSRTTRVAGGKKFLHQYRMGEIKQFRGDLLRWFAAHQRAFPWRENTRSISDLGLGNHAAADARAAVIPYYYRFSSAFRTFAPRFPPRGGAAGVLGRSRLLLSAAQHAAGRRADAGAWKFPSTYEEIRELPESATTQRPPFRGIAYDLPHAALDRMAMCCGC